MKIVSITILVVVVATTGAVLNMGPTPELETRQDIASLPVSVVNPEPVTEVSQRRLFSGITVAARRSELAFERTARLIDVSVDDGDNVKKDQVLATIDSRQLTHRITELQASREQQAAVLLELKNGAREETIQATKARRDALKAEADLAAANLKRVEDLFQRGATSQQLLDENRLRTASANARRQAAQKELRELKQGIRKETISAQEAAIKATDARLQQLQTDLKDSQLTAPYAGTIVNRRVDEGDIVGPQQPIFELIENQKMEARIGIPARLASLIGNSDHQILTGEQGDFSAKVVSVLSEVDPITRTQTVVLKIPQQHCEAFADGQLIKMVVIESRPLKGFRLPVAALAPGSRGLWSAYAIVKVGDQLQLEKRTVEVLQTDGEDVVVQGAIQETDQIVGQGVHRVVPGQVVTIVSGKPDDSAIAESPE